MIRLRRWLGAISPTSSYVICTNPRSGSWLLSEALTASGVAGNPREWFNELEEEQRIPLAQRRTSPEAAYGAYLDAPWCQVEDFRRDAREVAAALTVAVLLTPVHA